MATRAQTLTAARTSLENLVAAQLAAWEAAGCPPTFSVDGESYSWDSWLQTKLDAIERLTKQIQQASPFYVRSRLRG